MHETRQSTFTSVLKLGKLIQEKKKKEQYFLSAEQGNPHLQAR